MQLKKAQKKEQYNEKLKNRLLAEGFLKEIKGDLLYVKRKLSHATYSHERERMLTELWFNQVYDSYTFFDGFKTLEKCKEYLEVSPYLKSRYIIIKFREMYYAVVYHSHSSQQVIGKDRAYYTKNGFFLCDSEVDSRLKVDKRLKQKDINPIIYHELLAFSNIEAFMYKRVDATECTEIDPKEYMNFIVLLGISFKNVWYNTKTKKQIDDNRCVLNVYFKAFHGYTLFAQKEGAIQVNPFQRLLKFNPKLSKHSQKIEPFRTELNENGAWHIRANKAQLIKYGIGIRM